MGERSTIEWTDSSWNPVTGCTKVSAGCKNCYAERITQRCGQKFTDVKLHPDRLDLPFLWRKTRRIFVNSMSDLFHEAIPTEFVLRVFETMAFAKQHTFQVLTKRPERMKYLLSYGKKMLCDSAEHHRLLCTMPLPNVWLGVSVENQATADERIPLLLQTPAAVRFVSYEPALSPVHFTPWFTEHGIDWLIAGGESGPHARPAHPDWFRQARDQCQAAGVAFFFKQWGEFQPGYSHNNSRELLSRETKEFVAAVWMERVGKKRAGRLLDGREWNEYPEMSS